MNDINSCIIEGVVSTKLAYSAYEGTFTVTSHRYEKVGEEMKCEETFVHVIVRGKLLEFASEKCIEGRGIRVVGRFCNYNGGLSLFAEHLEFKANVNRIGKYNFKRD